MKAFILYNELWCFLQTIEEMSGAIYLVCFTFHSTRSGPSFANEVVWLQTFPVMNRIPSMVVHILAHTTDPTEVYVC